MDGLDAKGGEGSQQLKSIHYFDQIFSSITKEIDKFVEIAKGIMHLPKQYKKKKIRPEEDPDRGWEIISDCLNSDFQEIMKQSQDNKGEEGLN